MRIAFSFSGEGFGHTTRCAALAQELNEHELYFYAPKKVHKKFKEIIKNPNLKEVPIITLEKDGQKILYTKTLLKAIPKIFFDKKTINELAKDLKEKKIDCVIADYEPYLAKAAKKVNIPVVALNHQGIITKLHLFSPKALAVRVVNAYMIPHYDKLIVSSFYEGDVGALLRKEVAQAKVKNEEFYIIYFKGDITKRVEDILKKEKLPYRTFPNRDHSFFTSLAACKGVISLAGHQLMCEALFLKKPHLVFPQEKQFEQELNAEMLEKSGWGRRGSFDTLEEDISNFIKEISEYPKEQDESVNFITSNDARKTAKIILDWMQKRK